MKTNRIFLLSLFSLLNLAIIGQQTQSDSYTRYELLDPSSNRFRIIYDVSATTPGAIYYWNTLRKGSEHHVDAVYDLYTGKELTWKVVSGETAKENGHVRASKDTDYLQVQLARSVPEDGEARLRIDKTYADTESFFTDGEMIVFKRTLGIKRNSVVLPGGYVLVSCNYPSQVEQESDGRIKVSFMHDGDGAVDFELKGILSEGGLRLSTNDAANPWPGYLPQPQGRDKTKARVGYQIRERAFQDREIVYYLQQPESHSFRLYHDYTENRIGVDKYLNVVRAGSKATDPSAFILDTGKELFVETLQGNEISEKGIELANVTEDTEVVVIWFEAVKEGESRRLRIWETYTDPNRYLLHGDELIWDRSFGRNRNRVVLPEGWYLTHSSIPAKISLSDSGLVQLDFVNDRPDNIDVWIKAQRR